MKPKMYSANSRASKFMNGDFDSLENVHSSGDFQGLGAHHQMGDFWSDLRDKVLGVAKTQLQTSTGTTTTPTTSTTTTQNNTMKYVMYGMGALIAVGGVVILFKAFKKKK